MLQKFIGKFLKDSNQKAIKQLAPLVEKINEVAKKYETEISSEKDVKAKTEEFKKRIQEGNETVEDLLPEAFALVKRACKLLVGASWDIRGKSETWQIESPYDVQLIGGLTIHQGKIAEMRTGEGKTLVCTMPAYLNALTGDPVYIVTVNDYLAHRDAEWMGGLYRFLGLSVGVVYTRQPKQEKLDAYNSDIIYGTNNEFGFDYLRDNMATNIEQVVQKKTSFAIIDEIDSILIDESRTPLIISSPADESTTKYQKYSQLVQRLKENEHYNIDEKLKTATLSEEGIAKMEELLGVDNIYTEAGFTEVHHIEQALKAHFVFKKDIDYVVNDGEIVIVDSFTGRLMPGRRYSQGLHQAIEAKEAVEIKRESKTLATITFQNYFRLFDKLAGMTGTAKTEEEEFQKLYGLEVLQIPTNKPIAREDLNDSIYKNTPGKYKAIVKKTKEYNKEGLPVLIGTISIQKSEILSKLLKVEGIKHEVLNAKQHEREAEIVANAGQKGAVTIATNMAGRGTDIKLGEGIQKLGGLQIIGTERHESRRIDNQLRGRAGRQGDNGSSQFFVALDDELMRLFGAERIQNMMNAMNFPDDMPIENGFISNSIERAQKKVEGRNFDIRKQLVEYDDVMNKHREIIYAKRRKILENENLKNDIILLIEEEAEGIVLNHIGGRNYKEWNYDEIYETVSAMHKESKLNKEVLGNIIEEEKLIEHIKDYLINAYKQKEDKVTKEIMRRLEKAVYLRTIDILWMEHIDYMTDLKKNVAFSGYGQKDPLIVYKEEAFERFKELNNQIRSNTVNTIFKVELQQTPAQTFSQQSGSTYTTNQDEIESPLTGSSSIASDSGSGGNPVVIRTRNTNTQTFPKVGRNDPCPCGSGKKYKKCHGRVV